MNRQGLSDLSACNAQADTFKQVIHEETIRVAGASKAPDYTFRIGGRRTFFVEAKKPAVNVAEDSGPAFQLRRYAWTARLKVEEEPQVRKVAACTPALDLAARKGHIDSANAR